MATIYDLKPRFQALLRPLSDALVRARLTANDVTLGALLLSAAHGAWITLMPASRWPLLLLPVTLFLRMAFNAIDGMMAKEHGQASAKGAVLNELSDVIADAALYLPFALIPGLNAPLVVLLVVAGIIAEMAGALGPMIGAPRRYDGPLGKSDRAFAFGLLAVLLGLGLAPGLWSTLYLAALLLLSALTILNRARAIVAQRQGTRRMTTILGLPANVVYFTAGIYALLALATIVVLFMRWRNPGERYAELMARTNSWWWMIGAFTLAILLNQTVAVVFLALIAYLALKEYLSLVPTRRIDREVLLFAYLAIPIQFYWAAIDWYNMFIVFVPVWMFLFFPALMALRGQTQGFLRAVGTLSWGLMMTVYTLSHMAWLLVSGDRVNPVAGGVGLLFFLVVLTQFNDVAQYCWGKPLGRHKVTPNVSPKKTWEGLIGGIATTTLVAGLVGPYLTPMDWRWSALAGAILGVSGFLGDITMSAMKRDLGVKDTGGLIPGHGGILDRVDSLTYAAPVFVHFIRYFYFP